MDFIQKIQAKLYWPTAIFSWLFMIFSWIFVNWWVVLFAVNGTIYDKGEVRPGVTLPKWLAWFTTFDNDLDAGLLPGETPSWYTRTRWLYRNTAYGLDYFLGVPFDAANWKVIYVVHDDSHGIVDFEAVGPNGLFNKHFIKWGLRFKIGWKASNYYRVQTHDWNPLPWGPEYRLPFVFSISLAK